MRSIALLVACLMAAPAAAHEYTNVAISSFSRIGNGPWLEILLQDTDKGHRVVCAVMDADGTVIASERQSTAPFVTKVLINYPHDDAHQARCVLE